MKFISVFISLFFIFASYAKIYRHSSIFEGVEWKMAVLNHNYWDRGKKDILMISKIYGLLNHSFVPTVSLNAEYVLDTRQGVTQQTYIRRKSSGQIYSAHLYVSVQPWVSNPLFLRVGLVNQEFLNAPLLISDWTFIGLQQEYIFKNKTLLQYVDHLKLVVQQTIPSSDTDLDFLEQLQDIATFYTVSLFASDFIQNQVQARGNLTAFYYNNLSSVVAEYGRIYGNEVHPDYRGPNEEFPYPFYGLYTQGTSRLNVFPELGVEVGASFLWNIGATRGAALRRANQFPEDTSGKTDSTSKPDINEIDGIEITAKSIGYNAWIGLHIPISKQWLGILSLEGFKNESNASPAYYNSDRYAHSGRSGGILGVKFIFEKYNVFLDMQFAFIRSDVDTKQSIGNPNYLNIKIGTEYDKI